MSLEIYERDEFEKLKTVIDAACQNKTLFKELRISTTGTNPSASVTIDAHTMRKFLKPPKA
jgi:hypothetical protein